MLANRKEKFLDCYSRPEPGYLYCIRQGPKGPLKIGWAEDPKTRMAVLQTANPVPLTLLACKPGSRSEEAALQTKFESFRLSGE